MLKFLLDDPKKWGALACLVLQNSLLVVFMGMSRTAKGDMYYSSTAVTVMEAMKFVACIGLFINEKGLKSLIKEMKEEIFEKPVEILRLAVPSLLYTIQNNLLYFALSHLDAATYQVGYNIKILTTAVFSLLLIKDKKIAPDQWTALVLLTVGVVLVQYASHSNAGNGTHNTMSGFIAVLLAATTSGFAGAYTELVFKGKTGVLTRNLQMGCSSIPLGFIGIYASGELPGVLSNGFFHGYNLSVLNVITLQATGGLIVAYVTVYAGSIAKGFAAAISILTSSVLCYFLVDFQPTVTFMFGAGVVGYSTYLYNNPRSDTTSQSLPLLVSTIRPVERDTSYEFVVNNNNHHLSIEHKNENNSYGVHERNLQTDWQVMDGNTLEVSSGGGVHHRVIGGGGGGGSSGVHIV